MAEYRYMYFFTLRKSSDRSLGNFNILGQINNIQKIPLFFRERCLILDVIYQIFILIHQFTLFPSREKDRNPNSVKSHLIIQFQVLKLKKIMETLVFSEKDKTFFQYRVIINRVFIMSQCHKSIYSCSLIRLNASIYKTRVPLFVT